MDQARVDGRIRRPSRAHLKRARVLLAVLLATFPAWPPRVFALNPAVDVSGYGHTVWRRGEAFPSGNVYAIAQTSDGYLWLGGEGFLVRFDGVTFVRWEPPSGQQLPSTKISNLLVTRDDALWIGTLNGLAKWTGGKLQTYPELAGQGVSRLLEDRDGTVWVASFAPGSTGRLCAIRRGIVSCDGGDGTLGNGVVDLHQTRDGDLWVGVMSGLWRWSPGPPKFYPIAGQPYGVQGFAEDNGKLLVGLGGRVARIVEGHLETAHVYAKPHEGPDRVKLLRDRDGGLWVGTIGRGVFHIHNETVDAFAASDGLSGDSVGTLFEDREGNIWVSTERGLDRFRDVAVPTLSLGSAVAHPPGPVLAATDGSIWRNARDGLSRLRAGQITLYRSKPEMPAKRSAGVDHPREVIVPTLPAREYATFFEASDGRIWVFASGGVGYLQHDRFVSLGGIPPGQVYAVAEDASGNLWIANAERGLVRIHEDRMVEEIPWRALGPGAAQALATDSARSGVWLGFNQGGVAYFSDGQVRRAFTAGDGLGAGTVYGLHLDPDGTLWVATEGGLSRLKDDRFLTMTSRNGLPCDAVHWVMPDTVGSLWLKMPCALVRITRAELGRWASVEANDRSPHPALEVAALDESDGVRLGDGPGSLWPRVTRAPDGILWFSAGGRVSFLDPTRLSFNRLPPPVHIEQVMVDGNTYTPSAGLHLPSRVRDLSIAFTALSLVAPEKVRFRYKLEGQDPEWREVVNDRRVQYSNLPPGPYVFRVTASNNSGVWNQTGAVLNFTIAPAVYQTIWFRAFSVVMLLTLLFGLHRLRLRRVAYQFDSRLQERLHERTRIARELHDTLLQSVHGVMFRLQAVRNMLPGRTDEAIETLDAAIDTTERAIAESRDAIKDLRSAAPSQSDLGQALATFAKELTGPEPKGDSPTFRVTMEGEHHPLSPDLHDELCRIARELLRNAFRHAGAHRIEAEIRYEHSALCLRIRDDGKGIDASMLQGDRAGHWGLRGVRERAQRIGAQLDFWSEAGAGTEVQLQVPAAIAYQPSRAKAPMNLS